MTDADQGGEWVTGIIGEPFQVDMDGNPIPNAPSDAPTETPDPDAVRKAFDDVMEGLDAGDAAQGGGQSGWLDGLGDLKPTGILPGDSGQIGGNDDETQKEIWAEMERGEFGSGASSIPEDAETTI